MGHRGVRLGWVGLIVVFPLLIEAMVPGSGGTWAAAVGRVGLVELLVVGGMVLAARQRRHMRNGWYDGAHRAVNAPAGTPSPVVIDPAPRRRTIRVALPATPARPATVP
jgi:hypothetical protein